jgi:hypothetical protein
MERTYQQDAGILIIHVQPNGVAANQGNDDAPYQGLVSNLAHPLHRYQP